MNTTSKKFWVRFGLITLIPILLGIICASIFANQFKSAYKRSFKEKLKERDEMLVLKDSTINALLIHKTQLAHLSQFPSSAERELEKLESELKDFHRYRKLIELDSLVKTYQNNIERLQPSLDSSSQSKALLDVLVKNYTSKVLQMAWIVESSLRGEQREEKQNMVISVTERLLSDCLADNDEHQAEIEQIFAKVSSLEAQLKTCEKELVIAHVREGSNRNQNKTCDHQSCKIDMDKAILENQQALIGKFQEEVESLSKFTDWIFDKKMKKAIQEIQTKLQNSLDKINLELEKMNNP